MNYIVILLVLTACSAKPTRENGKVTRDAAPDPIEMQADVEAGPADAEMTIVTNDNVLRCLAEGVPPSEPGFATHVQAKLSDGQPSGVRVDGGTPALRGCLKGAFAGLKFSGGKILKVHLARAGAMGLKGKPFRLPAPAAPKKFE